LSVRQKHNYIKIYLDSLLAVRPFQKANQQIESEIFIFEVILNIKSIREIVGRIIIHGGVR
jgi:hypothetical protein